MTIEAGCLLVFADQAKARYIMVKIDLGPLDRRMAVSTLCAHSLTMNIVGLVTSEAVRWCFAMFLPGVMAIATGRVNVLAFQREVGAFVFER